MLQIENIGLTRGSTREDPKGAESAFHCLLRTVGLMRQVMEHYFARFGISGSQWAILRVLERAQANGESSLRPIDISERLLIQPPSVTGAVARLEREGLVQRCESERDLRVRRIKLSPEGKALVNRVLKVHQQQIDSLFGCHDVEEVQALAALLGKLQFHLENMIQHQPVNRPRNGQHSLTKNLS